MSQTPVPTEDLYLYSMHLLNAAESRAVEQSLRDSAEMRAELLDIRSDLACLALSVEQQPLPESARSRFLSTVASERPLHAAERTAQPIQVAQSTNVVQSVADLSVPEATPVAVSHASRIGQIYETGPKVSFIARLLPWAGWATAAGLALSTWTLHERSTALQSQVAEAQGSAARAQELSDKAVATSERAKTVLDTLGSRSAQRFLLTRQNTAPAPSARVTYVASTGSLVFQGNNLDSVPAEKTYELWLIPADKTAKPIPAGTFKPDARGFANLILPALPKGVTAATFGITMENVGGSQSPTLPILLIGA